MNEGQCLEIRDSWELSSFVVDPYIQSLTVYIQISQSAYIIISLPLCISQVVHLLQEDGRTKICADTFVKCVTAAIFDGILETESHSGTMMIYHWAN